MNKFKVGDRVRIRLWESMKKEFGTYPHGSIKVTAGFPPKMNNLCGHTATISDIDGKRVSLKDWDDDSLSTFWSFSTDMLEPALPRICYLLGGEDTPLEIGEEFEVEGEEPKYYISENGVMNITGSDNEPHSGLYAALNHPEKIIRKPKIEFSDDEKAFMRLLMGAGEKSIVRNADADELYVCNQENPVKDKPQNGFIGDYGVEFWQLPDFLLPQITYENSPVRMEEYL